jgi:putative ABC transport system permease protein
MSPRLVSFGLRRLFRKTVVEQELTDEVGHFLEMAIQERMRAGMPRADAERAAQIEFGGVDAAKEGVRAAGWDGAIDTLRRDIAYALRGLRRNRGFAVIAVLTLALGIGANTAMFSVVNAVLLRPLPYRDANRLALIWTDDIRRGLHQEATAFSTIEDWRSDTRAFQSIAYYNTYRTALIEGMQRDRTRVGFASGNLFSVLGVAPVRGRSISTVDEEKAENVAVISYALWQRRFNGDSSAIGTTIQTDATYSEGRSDGILRIVGIMPPGFYFPDKLTEIWTPATTYWRFRRERSERFPSWARRWTAIGRLKPDRTIDVAKADLSRVGNYLAQTYRSDVPDFPGFATNVEPILDHVAGRKLQSALWVLAGAVSLVLLVACANVANLLLARGATRQREFAIRRAIGAGRGRLVRQLIAESMVLALAGGVLGAVAATLGARTLGIVAAAYVPRIEEIAIDARVLLFAAAASILSGIVFGVIPAFRVSRIDPSEALKEGAQTSGGVRLRRMRGLLVMAECSLAIVLLAGAGLLLRSLSRVSGVDPGFDPTQVLTMRIELAPEPPPTAEERTLGSVIAPARAQARVTRMNSLLERASAVPGVETASFVDDMFVNGQGNHSITIPGRPPASLAPGELNEGAASPGFFETIRVPLRRGRYLTRDDAATKIRALWNPVNTSMSLADKERLAVPEPVVVNDAFVQRFFPGEDPVGKHFCIDPTNKTYWYTIVGVVGDIHRQGLERRTIPEYFGSYLPSPTGRADLLVRTKGDPLAFAATVRQLVTSALPGVYVGRVTTADRQLGDFSAERRFQTWLLAGFAGLALALAAIGIYGVVHYAVAERTREMGVRVALGASPANLMRLVIRQGMLMPMIGIVVGIGASLAATRVISHLLFGVGETDPVTFIAVLVTLTLVALAACVMPARRATRVNPITALRGD